MAIPAMLQIGAAKYQIAPAIVHLHTVFAHGTTGGDKQFVIQPITFGCKSIGQARTIEDKIEFRLKPNNQQLQTQVEILFLQPNEQDQFSS